MLTKSKRLSTALFSDIIEKGQSFHNPFLIIKVKKTDKISRFAVSVPKKVAKTAVLRNKIKKKIYSIIKNFEKKIILGFNVIFIAKIGVDKLKFTDLSNEIDKIFVKIGILK